MSAERSDETAARLARRGTGPMIVIIVACVLLGAGSLGAIGYFAWRMARSAEERADQAAADADLSRHREVEVTVRQQYEQIATAMAAGLQEPNRLADSYAPGGKPLLSWRVHLLPRLGEQELYRQFKLNEPWDSPANLRLLKQVPAVYVPPHRQVGTWQPGWTCVRGFSQDGGVFSSKSLFGVNGADAGPDNVLAIFDSGDPVEWTRPDQLRWRDDNSKPKVGGSLFGARRFLAAMVSGRVVWIDESIPADVLRQISSQKHEPSWDLRAREWIE